jgi:hypothetical protein
MVRMASDGPKEWTIIELQVICPRGLCPRAVACPQPDAEIAVLSFLWADLIAVVLTRKGEFETRDSSEGCKLDNLEIGKLSCKGGQIFASCIVVLLKYTCLAVPESIKCGIQMAAIQRSS